MNNKNLLWIVAGVGAGYVAFHLWCKKKGITPSVASTQEVAEEEVAEEEQEGETSRAMPSGGGGGGGGAIPTAPTTIVATPILTAPIIATNPINPPPRPKRPRVELEEPIGTLSASTSSVKWNPKPRVATRPTIVADTETRPRVTTRPTIVADTEIRPRVTTTTPRIVTPRPYVATITSGAKPMVAQMNFSGFDGGGDCFELKGCLNDLY